METNRIIQGDALEELKKLPDNSVDLVVTDPPYRIHAKSGGGLHRRREWLKNVHKDKLDEFEPIRFLNEAERVLKNFHAYIFCSKGLLCDYINWFEEKELNWEVLIYAKNNPIPTKNNKYLSDKEYCLFIRGKDCYFNNNLRFDLYKTVQFVNVTKNKWHPTEKDLKYVMRRIKFSSRKGDVILDPFLGSGTTAVACKKLRRKYIGIEISKKYCEIARERVEKTSISKSLHRW